VIDAAALVTLLDVQALDTAIDQRVHRRAHLPERTELDARTAALTALAAEVAPRRTERAELARAQKAVEDELARLEEKAAGVDKALYSGAITNVRELQGLQQEVGALGRRCEALEEQVLEKMLEAEPVDEAIAAAEARGATLDAEAVTWTASVAEAEVAIDVELAELAARRSESVASVAPELLATYEDFRRRFAGVGIARLEHGMCTGCHLTIPPAQVTEVRRTPEGALPTCPECSRILVVG
jgi:predicted  nucleic acid-binding Zn-ribbon protein